MARWEPVLGEVVKCHVYGTTLYRDTIIHATITELGPNKYAGVVGRDNIYNAKLIVWEEFPGYIVCCIHADSKQEFLMYGSGIKPY